MEKVLSIIKMVDIMRDNGKMIGCMDMGNCIIILRNQHIKEIGLWINFMDMEKYIMIYLKSYINLSIIRIFKILKNIGNIMKVNM